MHVVVSRCITTPAQAPWLLHLSLISSFPLIIIHLCLSTKRNEVVTVTSRNRVVVVVSTIACHMGMGSLTWLESVRGRLSTMIPTRGNAIKQSTICSLLVTMMNMIMIMIMIMTTVSDSRD
jgi:hypothetical protein